MRPHILILVAACGASAKPPPAHHDNAETRACAPPNGHGVAAGTGTIAGLVVHARIDGSEEKQRVQVTIENRSGATIELANGLAIEHHTADVWQSVSDRELAIAGVGGAAPPKCVRVAPGASLVADEEWLGMTCFGGCPCHRNAEVPRTGSYRVIAYSCARDAAVASERVMWLIDL